MALGAITTALTAGSAALNLAGGAASFFGGGGKDRPYVTVAENAALEAKQAATRVTNLLRWLQGRLPLAKTPEQVLDYYERFVAFKAKDEAATLKNYEAVYGKGMAEQSLANVREFRAPAWEQGIANAAAMAQARIDELEAPAKAAAQAVAQDTAETRLAQKIAHETTAAKANTWAAYALAGLAAWVLLAGKRR